MELILPKPGRYIIAVSGGLDSVCLLDLMARRPDYELIVAHFDHGIREDSVQDQEFVSKLAGQYKLKYISERAELGSAASEAKAREARYSFFKRAQEQTKAIGILTAHHQDDRLETLVINLLRGTGRRGVSSIINSKSVKRPLLNTSRKELETYAKTHALIWREDTTNSDEKYLRNYIRLKVLPKLSVENKQQLINLVNRQQILNQQIDELIGRINESNQQARLDLKLLNSLPYKLSSEFIADWLRQNELANFNRKTIDRLTIAAKTKPNGSRINVYGRASASIEKGFLALHS